MLYSNKIGMNNQRTETFVLHPDAQQLHAAVRHSGESQTEIIEDDSLSKINYERLCDRIIGNSLRELVDASFSS